MESFDLYLILELLKSFDLLYNNMGIYLYHPLYTWPGAGGREIHPKAGQVMNLTT